MRRGIWIAAALGAAAVITLLALHGQRSDPAGLARFEAADVMLALEPAQVTASTWAWRPVRR